MTQHVDVHWRDANLVPLQSHFNVQDGADVGAVLTALEAASNAGIEHYSVGPLVLLNQVPHSAVYSRVLDLAALQFCTAAGACTALSVPAPKQTIFHPDQTEVDAAQIDPLIQACLGHLCTVNGLAVSRYDSGWRTSLRRQGH